MSDRLLLEKTGRAKFISHLDLMRCMQRVFARTGVMIRHTSGFNPHPYISFALPLSVGTESVCELMDFELADTTDLKEIPVLVNRTLPEGLRVINAYESDRKFKYIKWLKVSCRLEYDGGITEVDEERIYALFAGKTLQVEKTSKRGVSVVDILPLLDKLSWERFSETELCLTALVSAQEPSLSPAAIVSAIVQRLPELKPDFMVFRRLEVYDKDLEVFR